MAKKNPKEQERRALVEKMRSEQARKEKRRSMLILGACIVVVLGLLSAALVPYLKDRRDDNRVRNSPVDKLGVTEAQAACGDVETKVPTGSDVSGAEGSHVADGTSIDYANTPPAFGQHWQTFLRGTQIRNFWTVGDRPAVEQLVHSLEHGHTFLWYDDTIKPGTDAYEDLQDIATKFSDNPDFNIAPWTSDDGDAFPEGKHIALTHWAGQENQKGVWKYCGAPSGQVINDFLEDYPKSDSPEPRAE